MSETDNGPTLLSDSLRAEIKGLVLEAIQEANGAFGHHNGDRLLDAEDAAKMLCVSEDWLYHHHKKLPFSRKLAPKVLRFSYQGIQKYLATRKTS